MNVVPRNPVIKVQIYAIVFARLFYPRQARLDQAKT